MVEIKLEKLNKSYGKLHVLKDIDIVIEKGDVCVLIGESGCGKTTLLELIAGLQQADSGKIIFNNNDVSDVIPSKRNVSMVFQDYALYPNMNVYNNIAFPLKIKKESKNEIDTKVKDMLELVNLKDKIKNSIQTLSGGQKQRVAIARALVTNPDIFLLDEPLSNLDTNLKHDLRKEVGRIQKSINATTVYVTHDKTEALNIASKIALLKDGRIVQYGSVEELLTNPKSLYVLEFFFKNSLNVFTKDEYNLIFNQKIECDTVAIKATDITIGSGISCVITDIEYYETQQILRVNINNKDILVSVNEINKYSVNDEVEINIDTKNLYIF